MLTAPHSVPLSAAHFFLTLTQELIDLPPEKLAEVLIERLCSRYGAHLGCIHLHDKALEAELPGCHRRCPPALAPRAEQGVLMRAEASWLALTQQTGRPVSMHEAIAAAPPAMLLRNYFPLTDGLSIPILYRGEHMGTINLYLQDSVLGPADVQVLSGLGGVVYGLLKRHQMMRDLRSRDEVIGALARSVEAKDPYTGQHLERVRSYAVNLARSLGLPEEEVEAVDQAALLHDIGKIGVPDAVLNKIGPLDESEWALMKRHPITGTELFQSVRAGTLKRLLPGIRWHHERPDGRGYPDGLTADQIPLIARIIAVADAYDALTSDRPYRKGLEPEAALQILRSQAGAQFCPVVVEKFVEAGCYLRMN